jgi:hypothetical protein
MVIPMYQYSLDDPLLAPEDEIVSCECFFPNGVYVSVKIPKNATISELKEVSSQLIDEISQIERKTHPKNSCYFKDESFIFLEK